MNPSELILKTYRDITNKLDKPYYVLKCIPAERDHDQIVHSSSNLKDVFGLTQLELSRDSNLFFNSIHPDFIENYFESNQKLLQGISKDKRTYLIKNKETGNYIRIEELATSRINKDLNCFEIYCSLKSIHEIIDDNSIEVDSEKNITTLEVNENKDAETYAQVFDCANYFVESMSRHFKLTACRYYGFNEPNMELYIFADTQNKISQQTMELSASIKTKAIVPKYNPDSLIFKLLQEKSYTVLDEKADILEVLKNHTENSILKKFAGAALRIYNLKSFGVLPVVCPDGKILGLVTFGSSNKLTDEEKKEIYDFTTTNSLVFCNLLNEYCTSAEK
jgi:hypothetical protein